MRLEWLEGDEGIRVEAPAKINVFLEVLGRRADGYHELDSLFHAVSLCDTLEFRVDRSRDPGAGEIALEVLPADESCAGDLCRLPPRENLISRATAAVRSWAAAAGRGERVTGLSVRLVKRIPVGAGLGGGSSDAAATLVALDRLWELAIPRATLQEMAAALGSDVPFFLHGGLARCRGRGEIVLPIGGTPADENFSYVLVTPAVEVSTSLVYGHLAAVLREGIDLTIPKPLTTMNFSDIRQGMREGRLFRNRLQDVAFHLFPVLREFHGVLQAEPFVRVQLTGSGGALFGFCWGQERASELARRVEKRLRDTPLPVARTPVHVVEGLPSWSGLVGV